MLGGNTDHGQKAALFVSLADELSFFRDMCCHLTIFFRSLAIINEGGTEPVNSGFWKLALYHLVRVSISY